MKINFLNCKVIVGVLIFLVMSTSHAKGPMWTLTPVSGSQTKQTVSVNATSTVQYTVVNQSSRSKNLIIQSMPGIVQTSSCQLQPKGMPGSSCILNLAITGSALPVEGIHGGPRLCQANSDGSPNPNQCYQPSPQYILQISRAEVPPNTSLSASVSELALSVNNLTNGPVGPIVPSGTTRTIIITNTGLTAATGIQVNNSAFPSGTSLSTNCNGTLNVGDFCEVNIEPGNTANPDINDNPCNTTTPGTEPIPASVTVTANNAPQTSVNILVLGYGCIYQGGYLFSVDDSTVETSSIAGKVAVIGDQSMSTIWGPNEEVGGINQDSTQGLNSCDGDSDGKCNTARIIDANLTPPVAAQLCADLTDGNFNDWYLPAVCEMGYDAFNDGTNCGNQAAPLLQNIFSTLIEGANKANLNGIYWASTESVTIPAGNAFSFDSNDSAQTALSKTLNFLSVRCVRSFPS